MSRENMVLRTPTNAALQPTLCVNGLYKTLLFAEMFVRGVGRSLELSRLIFCSMEFIILSFQNMEVSVLTFSIRFYKIVETSFKEHFWFKTNLFILV
jgi:hypothetical protein